MKKGLDEGLMKACSGGLAMEKMESDRIAKCVLVVIQWVGSGRDGLIM